MTVAIDRKELNMAKSIHLFWYATATYMELGMRTTDLDKEKLKMTYHKVQGHAQFVQKVDTRVTEILSTTTSMRSSMNKSRSTYCMEQLM